MGRLPCFCGLLTTKKRNGKTSGKKGHGASQLSLARFIRRSSEKELKESTLDRVVPVGSHESSPLCGIGVVETSDTRPPVLEAAAYDGGDDILSIPTYPSQLDLGAEPEIRADPVTKFDDTEECMSKSAGDGASPEMATKSGHLSDPGIGASIARYGSPVLKRSCSHIERRIAGKPSLAPARPLSFDDLRTLPANRRKEVSFGVSKSPSSVHSSCSADRVMLKKRSSSQVLPSRSRKIWWKLFLWSHRNLHKQRSAAFPAEDISNPMDGYSSDTVEPNHSSRRHGKTAAEASRNQWVAFDMETSPIDRVKAWMNMLEDDPIDPREDDDDDSPTAGDPLYRCSYEVGESSGKNRDFLTARRQQEEILQANNIVQSLNSVSAVAHISGMGLKVIPTISSFSSLRAVNLSSNSIVHIAPGALPRSLHTLDVSRNKITTIEGLRELTRLRVLNLSYNKISKIGHGLSNCTLVKELYLAGNKISTAEGLHRLLKLGVLDLSFNKICTAKSLGQLVANFYSLLAVNLIGNPIQRNIGDDQLRKVVTGLLPHLAYLNKQPVKLSSAREAVTDRVARAALGDHGWNSRRRRARKTSQGSGSSARGGSCSGRHRLSSSHRHSSPSRSRRMP